MLLKHIYTLLFTLTASISIASLLYIVIRYFLTPPKGFYGVLIVVIFIIIKYIMRREVSGDYEETKIKTTPIEKKKDKPVPQEKSEDIDAIETTIEKAMKGINQYLEIMRLFPVTDVNSDKEFQRKYNNFYRIIKREQQFYNVYYKLMQQLKGKDISFPKILKYLHEALGRYEPSFSSKLLHTHNPNMPIWDSNILKNIKIEPPSYDTHDRMVKTIEVYEDIINWYKEYLNTDEAKLIIKIFDNLVNEPSITDLKKIDFFLWKKPAELEPEPPIFTPPPDKPENVVNDIQVINAIRYKFSKTGSPAKIPLLKGGRTFSAKLSEKENGIYVDNLGGQPFLGWNVFQETARILNKNGGRAKRGDAMSCKLGEPGLPFNSIEGHIASVVYGKKLGDIVFRRITPIACILIWAGVCKAAPGEIILRYPIEM